MEYLRQALKNNLYPSFPPFLFFPTQETKSSMGPACEIEPCIMMHYSSQASHCPGTKDQIPTALSKCMSNKESPYQDSILAYPN